MSTLHFQKEERQVLSSKQTEDRRCLLLRLALMIGLDSKSPKNFNDVFLLSLK